MLGTLVNTVPKTTIILNLHGLILAEFAILFEHFKRFLRSFINRAVQRWLLTRSPLTPKRK